MNTVFCIFRNSDSVEGRGYTILDSIWANRKDAEKYFLTTPKIHVMGVVPIKIGQFDVREYPLHSNFEDKIKFDHNELKMKALNKLTKEEKEVLGL